MVLHTWINIEIGLFIYAVVYFSTQNCKADTSNSAARLGPDDIDDDGDDDDEPAEDMDAYVESGKLEAEDHVMINMLSLYWFSYSLDLWFSAAHTSSVLICGNFLV